MTMYLVRVYVDCRDPMYYGVNDKYYAIGLFDSEEKANEVKKAKLHVMETCYEDKYDIPIIDIIPIEVNKVYNAKEQIYLGGGCYIE